MPVISFFYGLIIRMHWESTGKHHVPHIHVEHAEYKIVLSLEGEVIEGSLPSSKMKLVQAWIELHKEDLKENWKLASEGREVFKIEPLR